MAEEKDRTGDDIMLRELEREKCSHCGKEVWTGEYTKDDQGFIFCSKCSEYAKFMKEEYERNR